MLLQKNHSFFLENTKSDRLIPLASSPLFTSLVIYRLTSLTSSMSITDSKANRTLHVMKRSLLKFTDVDLRKHAMGSIVFYPNFEIPISYPLHFAYFTGFFVRLPNEFLSF